MESEKFILNEILAYIQTELGAVDENVILGVCLQNFSKDEITHARSILYDSLNMASYLPSFADDKDGESSLQNIIDCLRDTDYNLVPTFVARDWRKLPSVSVNQEVIKNALSDIAVLKKNVAKAQNDIWIQKNRRCCCIHAAAAEVVAEASPPLTPPQGFAAAVKTHLVEIVSATKPMPPTQAKPPTATVPPNNSMPSEDVTPSSEPTPSGEPMASAETVGPAQTMPTGVLSVKSELHFVTVPPALPVDGEMKIFITVHMPENTEEIPSANVVIMVGSPTPISVADVNLPSIALAFEGAIPGRRAPPTVDVEEEEQNDEDSMDRPYAGSSHFDDASADIETRLIERSRSKKLAARKAKKSRKEKAKKNESLTDSNNPRRRHQ